MAGFATVIASITKLTTILFMAASEAHPNANCKQQQGDNIWEGTAKFRTNSRLLFHNQIREGLPVIQVRIAVSTRRGLLNNRVPL